MPIDDILEGIRNQDEVKGVKINKTLKEEKKKENIILYQAQYYVYRGYTVANGNNDEIYSFCAKDDAEAKLIALNYSKKVKANLPHYYSFEFVGLRAVRQIDIGNPRQVNFEDYTEIKNLDEKLKEIEFKSLYQEVWHKEKP